MSLLAQIAVGDNLFVDLARTIALAVIAGVVGIVVGIVHRWYAGSRVPDGLSVLVGLSVVAIYLNTAGALGEVIGGELDLLAIETAIFNTVTFVTAGATAVGGGRIGGRISAGVVAISGKRNVDRDVSRIVRTVGRVTTVQVPEGIDDIVGYDPVDAATKEAIAGQVLVFPRRLTVGELRSRFVERLKTDYGVGHVDVEFADDGTVEFLALGSRESGIGSTLPPGSAAIAVWADPPNNASPGDAVQVWTDGDPASGTQPQRVTTAELRGTADDLVTLALDESDARRLDTDRRYRLLTLPVEPRADREFAAQLRTAEETMGVVVVDDGSVLAGSSIGAVDIAVVAVSTVDGDVVAIPTRDRVIAPGETLYVIARPDQLRKLEVAAGAPTQPAPEPEAVASEPAPGEE